ncbi:MAG TPA: hypothetical protein VFE07_13285 [Marmoricola sp.]|nr:hypothetical protein [Marmoricola sp.]
MSSPSADRSGPQVCLILLALVGFIALVGGVSHLDDTDHSAPERTPIAPTAPATPGAGAGESRPAPLAPPTASPAAPAPVRDLPGGGRRIFAGHRFLVAYYGTARTGALGVLGEASPEAIMPRLVRAAAPFARDGRTVQPVFELIVTVAHAGPTRAGTYSSNIQRADVRRYVRAAHRHGVLLVLDLQPGRADFLDVAKTWEWALRDPWVGLALDPEWRMGPHGVPGRRIGSVSAGEVNRVSAWLDQLTSTDRLPEKLFLVHQFRTDMVRHIERIRSRSHLALVQHVDGFGTRGQKLDTFHHVVRPRQFRLGFKLFYDEDVHRMRPAQVLAIRPRVSFVSFQ